MQIRGYFQNLIHSTRAGFQHSAGATATDIRESYYDSYAKEEKGYNDLFVSVFRSTKGEVTPEVMMAKHAKDSAIVSEAKEQPKWKLVQAKAVGLGFAAGLVGGISGFTAGLVGGNYLDGMGG